MSGRPGNAMTHLTVELARRFIEMPGTVDLTSVATIDDAAAEVIIGFLGELHLVRLRRLSIPSASPETSHLSTPCAWNPPRLQSTNFARQKSPDPAGRGAKVSKKFCRRGKD